MATPLTADQLLEAAKMFGAPVREYAGWRQRGMWRIPSKGFDPKWITIHHTAGEANYGVERYIRDILVSDPSVPDKCTVAIDRDGVIWMVTAGRANHHVFYSQEGFNMAVNERWPIGGPSVNKRGSLQNGNRFSYGVECIAAGTPNQRQFESATKWAAGMCKVLGWTAGSVLGHGELGYDRDFSDPGWRMGDFRAAVADLLGSKPAPAAAPAPVDNRLAEEAKKPWWGNKPYPQEPAFLSVACLKAAMEHDCPAPDQGLYWFADQVWAVQRMLESLGWLGYGRYVAGHYGTYTKGNGHNQDDGGVAGFQVRRGGVGDGWMGKRELAKLCEMAGKTYEIKD